MTQKEADNRSNGGIDVDWNDQPTAAGSNPRVVLDAHVGMGQVVVSHNRSAVYERRFGDRFHSDLSDQTNTGCEVSDATR
jgi:hypothetical protein